MADPQRPLRLLSRGVPRPSIKLAKALEADILNSRWGWHPWACKPLYPQTNHGPARSAIGSCVDSGSSMQLLRSDRGNFNRRVRGNCFDLFELLAAYRAIGLLPSCWERSGGYRYMYSRVQSHVTRNISSGIPFR